MGTVSKSCTFGELELAFSTNLKLAWTTWGGHCHHAASFFNPEIESGDNPFYGLGSYPIKKATDPGKPDSSSIAALMVRAAPGAGKDGLPPLAAPVGWDWLWNDSHSRSRMDGTCWKPVPPKGYTALGAYFKSDHGSAPAANDPTVMVCVRDDLLALMPAAEELWNDSGSGHHGDLAAWAPKPEPPELEEGVMYVSTGTFVTSGSYGSEPKDELNVLYLPANSSGKAVEPPVPAMTGFSRPPNPTPVPDYEVQVPFTAVNDPGKSTAWKIAESPFYTLQRRTRYYCIEFHENHTGSSHMLTYELTTGLTKERSKQFEAKVGVTVSAEGGVSFLGSGGKVSASLTTEFGWTSSSAETEMRSETRKLEFEAPAKHAVTLWRQEYYFVVLRGTGKQTPGELAFLPSGTSTYSEQYPPPSQRPGRRAVEPAGFEPAASSVQGRRSAN